MDHRIKILYFDLNIDIDYKSQFDYLLHHPYYNKILNNNMIGKRKIFFLIQNFNKQML